MAVDESYFAKVLGIGRPWKVVSVILDEKEEETHVTVGTERGSTFPCPECGRECKIHDFYDREWRSLDLGSSRCIIRAKVPRTDCPEHGVRQIPVPWAREYSRYSLRFERMCMRMISEMPVDAVARMVRMSDDSLWRIMDFYVEEANRRRDLSGVKRVGVDETQCKKGQDYISVFVDMDTRKVLFATPGRDSDTVKRFVGFLKEHGGSVDNITDVSSDMSSAFLSGVAEHIPKAKVTLDRFHVMQLAGEAVDEVRKSVQKDKKIKLNIKYQLLKNRKRLSEEEASELDDILEENMLIASAYMLKEMLGDLYLLENEAYGRIHLDKWIRMASAGVHESVKTLAETISLHKEGILKWFASKLSNGILEGINSVIQLVKRMARGYRDRSNMINMLYLKCSDLEL